MFDPSRFLLFSSSTTVPRMQALLDASLHSASAQNPRTIQTCYSHAPPCTTEGFLSYVLSTSIRLHFVPSSSSTTVPMVQVSTGASSHIAHVTDKVKRSHGSLTQKTELLSQASLSDLGPPLDANSTTNLQRCLTGICGDFCRIGTSAWAFLLD